MADPDSRPPARGDEAELFRAFNHELVQSVARSVRGSSPHVIEDACSYAWAQFMEHQPDRDRNWKGWLFRVAQRESWRLDRERGQDVPLRTYELEPGTWLPVDQRDHYAIRDDLEDAFSILERLPPRLQRIAMLRALGMRYREIGALTGDSQIRVAQLIARANFEIYEVLVERSHETEHVSARAQRLWELERDQPRWLTERIGRAPRSSRRSVAQTEQRRAWRRAALALDDYRTASGPERFDDAIDTRPADQQLGGYHDIARRAVDELAHVRGRSIGRGLGD
jgi:RNA polymerase sigma factor (sigma-70 family)